MTDPIFRAKFPYAVAKRSGTALWVAIHAARCNAARDNQDYNVWDLEARTLPDALAELERTEELTDRGIPIRLCPCVGGTKGKLPVQRRSGAAPSLQEQEGIHD